MNDDADKLDWEEVKRLRVESIATHKAWKQAEKAAEEAQLRAFEAHRLYETADTALGDAFWPERQQ